jgi:hypothetical protein
LNDAYPVALGRGDLPDNHETTMVVGDAELGAFDE